MNKLWYKQPASVWEEALPLGNGRLGAMVFGGVREERIQVNEESMWYGGKAERINPDASIYLPQIREMLRNGQIAAAQDLMGLALTGCPEGVHPYQTLGDIFITYQRDGSLHNITDYERSLDLKTASCHITYQYGDTFYNRETFISKPANCMIMKLSATGKERLNFRVKMNRGKYYDGVEKCGDNGVCLYGNLGKDGFEFAMILRASVNNGHVKTIGETIIVEDATEAVLYFCADTTYHFEDRIAEWGTETRQKLITELKLRIDHVIKQDYSALFKEHTKDYQTLFNRVELTLSENNLSDLPTDELLKQAAVGKEDVSLAELLFQFGRYLMISSSRPGDLPATLQGIWNQEFLPPWDSKYTININTEMNYWPAETCNLSECHEPLFDLIRKLQINGRKVARQMYGCRGFVAHHNTDIHGDCAPQDLWIPATYWVMGAAWLCTHLWTHYEYTKNFEFLKAAYPVMAEAALFFLDYLEEKDGYLVTNPSCSPENTYILPSGESGCACIGASMDIQIIRDIFTECSSAYHILEQNNKVNLNYDIPDINDINDLQQQIDAALQKLPPVQVDSTGRIMEWMEEYEEAEPGHRHISHLYALYPSDQITVDGTPELAVAARKTLEYRLNNGGGHTGWSRAWIMNHYAKLWDGEKAWENICQMLAKSTYPNMFDKHPPFQIDGNFGVTAAIAQMLVQSRENKIILLPALPKAWNSGSVSGLCVIGNATISISWSDGHLKECYIESNDKYEGQVIYEDTVKSVRIKNEKIRVY